jgi:hypothetical protein
MTDPSHQTDADRETLARQQAALVAALHQTAPPPDGFTPAHVQTAAESLARKRSRSVQKSWPATAAALGETFDSHFSSYCAHHPSPPESPYEDGVQFTQWLQERRLLPPEARQELTRHRVHRDGLPRLLYSRRALTLLFRTGKSVRSIRIGF